MPEELQELPSMQALQIKNKSTRNKANQNFHCRVESSYGDRNSENKQRTQDNKERNEGSAHITPSGKHRIFHVSVKETEKTKE